MSRRIAAAVAASALCLVPELAAAATVTVRLDPDKPFASDEVYYLAAPGERNQLLVAYAGDARSITVTDPGAVIAAQGPCVSLDAHSARCTRRPATQDESLHSTRVDLGDGDDEVSTTRPGPGYIGGVIANGGPGNDRLDGGAGADRLDGGGGRDELYGGAEPDVLTDGDRDGAAGDLAPGPDLLDGGPGRDEVRYARRTTAVRVDIGDRAVGGRQDEGDVVRGFEDVTGGAGDDRPVGNDEANDLVGGAGRDVLIARGGGDRSFSDTLFGGPGADRLSGGDGPDWLRGGPARDRLSCGRGRDVVRRPGRRELLSRACETLRFEFGGDDPVSAEVPAYPKAVRGGTATFLFACPRLASVDGRVACNGRLTLREAAHPRRVLGRGRVADDGTHGDFSVLVALNALGQRRIRRGVRTLVSIRSRAGFSEPVVVPLLAWTIRLRA